MMRVAFTMLGGSNWTGGHNYLLNLLRVLGTEFSDRITPVLFIAEDSDEESVSAFDSMPGIEIVRSPLLNVRRRKLSLIQALLLGRDLDMVELLARKNIDLIFEAAQFFGWRLGIPAIAWIPDFQHLSLPKMFSPVARWKREIGCRAQIFGRRHIMLSSEDARQICLSNYAIDEERTRTVHFAVPAGDSLTYIEARAVADEYQLPPSFFYLPNQMWRHKNHTLVLQALALLKKRGISMFVATSGKQHDPRDPEVFNRLLTMVDELQLRDNVRFLGMIPYSHLSALMRASSALINPSLSEGWSTTVEEARAMGVPMLLSDLDVHREQMAEQATYFDRSSATALADAMRDFQVLNETRRSRKVEQARISTVQRVTRFGADFTQLVEDCLYASKRR